MTFDLYIYMQIDLYISVITFFIGRDFNIWHKCHTLVVHGDIKAIATALIVNGLSKK